MVEPIRLQLTRHLQLRHSQDTCEIATQRADIAESLLKQERVERLKLEAEVCLSLLACLLDPSWSLKLRSSLLELYDLTFYSCKAVLVAILSSRDTCLCRTKG